MTLLYKDLLCSVSSFFCSDNNVYKEWTAQGLNAPRSPNLVWHRIANYGKDPASSRTWGFKNHWSTSFD